MQKIITLLAIGSMLLTVSCQKQIDQQTASSPEIQTDKFSPESYIALRIRTEAGIKAKMEGLNKLSARLLAKSSISMRAAKKPPQAYTINVPGDYATIQQAVDNAVAGAIIQVVGNYSENVMISGKSNIKIDGGSATTLTRSPADAFTFAIVNSSGIVINGFFIHDGPVLVQSSRQIEVSWNDLTGAGDGIDVISSEYCTISDNYVANHYHDDEQGPGDGDGILLQQSNNCTISTNYTYNNEGRGILLLGSSLNKVTGNQVTAEVNTGIGLFPYYLTESTLQIIPCDANSLENNSVADGGIAIFILGDAMSNILKVNNLNYNDYGIILDGSSSGKVSKTNLSGSQSFHNKFRGLLLWEGASENTITNSKFNFNDEIGIECYYNSVNNTFRKCEAASNSTCDYLDNGVNNRSTSNIFQNICH